MRLPRRSQLRLVPAALVLLMMLVIDASRVLAGPAEAVTFCGQMVAKRGVLTADLDCSAYDGTAVVLGKNAKLDLGGFTLTANIIGVSCHLGRCEVRGPGTIRRPTYDPMLDHFSEGFGISVYYGARVRDVTLEHWNHGVRSLAALDVRNCTARDGGWGVVAGPIKVVGSTFTGNAASGVRAYEGTQDGVHYRFYACKVKASTFSGNSVDIESYRQPVVRLSTCTTSDHLTLAHEPFGGGDEWGVCP